MTLAMTPRSPEPKADGASAADAASARPIISYETISRLLPIADLAIVLGASIIAVIIIVNIYPVYSAAGLTSLYGLGLVASGLYVFRMRDIDFYDAYVVRQSRVEVRLILETWTVSAIVLLSLIYLFKLEHLDVRRAFISIGLLAPALLILWRAGVKRLVRYAIDHNAVGRRNVIVIGDAGEFAAPDCDTILDRLGVVGATRFALAGERDGPLSESDRDVIDAAVAFAQEHGASEAVILAAWGNAKRLTQLRGALRTLPISARLLPDRQIRAVTNFSSEGPRQLLQVELQRAPLTDGELLVKRVMDIVLSSLALVVLAVPMLVAGLLLRLESPGPAIFRQQRIGFNRRTFTIYKFRTMRVQEDGQSVRQAQPGDNRVTRLGRILRATSFDEIPQLFNVLLGDMSLVGPRPHAIVHDHEFEAELAEYAYRRRVKPGITGWAQCKGRRGPTPTVDHVRERVELDLWYITNWSVMLDVYIILKTILVLFRQKNAL